MTSIAEAFAVRIASGLKRKSITRASKWAERYRMMGNPHPGPWTFDRHPWGLEMHDAPEEKIIGQKAAQMGFTEWAMNMAFYYMDIHSHDVLYVLPTSDDASDFSAARFDPALELSPYLRNFFADVNNVGLKRAGNSILYVRGSHSRSKLKSIPAPIMIWDEVDEMPPSSLSLGEERQSGQDFFRTLQLSTPSIEGKGINADFQLSTQDFYTFKCPCCSRRTELVYPDCLVLGSEDLTDVRLADSHLICKECKGKLPHETKQSWLKSKLRGGTAKFEPRYPGRSVRGFGVSQLYSMSKKCAPPLLAEAVLKARYDVSRAQELHNSKLGLCFTAPGAKITETMIEKLKRDYVQGPTNRQDVYVTMGIDVGSVLHIVVREWHYIGAWHEGLTINDQYRPRILLEIESTGSPDDFEEAYKIFMDYRVHGCVCDAEPERRAAMQFARRVFGRIYLCDYLFSQSGRELSENEDELTLKANRTAWMDLSLGRYKYNLIDLPKDISPTFVKHLREPTRVLKEDKYGNPYATYENVNADHFAHADVYSEIALAVAVSIGSNRTITELV